jgi:hypothetical protein
VAKTTPLKGTASALDSATGSLSRLRYLVGTASALDSATSTLSRLRYLVGTSSALDSAMSTLTVLSPVKHLTGTSSALDSSAGAMTVMMIDAVGEAFWRKSYLAAWSNRVNYPQMSDDQFVAYCSGVAYKCLLAYRYALTRLRGG